MVNCGGVLRNAFGTFLNGFIHNLGSYSITKIKIWGMFFSFHLAWEFGDKLFVSYKYTLASIK